MRGREQYFFQFSSCAKKQICLFGCMLLTLATWSQETRSADQMYTLAREEAFEHKNYEKAISLMEEVIQRTPENVDYAIFLGRLYTWYNKEDKAREILAKTFANHQDYADAGLAYASLEFWTKNSEKALEIVDKALGHHKNSEALLVLKAKILVDLKRSQDASIVLNYALELYPKSTTIRSLIQQTGASGLRNEVGLSYDFVYFKERFEEPWHLIGLHYGRQTGIGPILGRVSYGNRFGAESSQFEVDFYPRISNTFYAYLNAGISGDTGVFPQYRTGLSLYANLPLAFELDGGFRLLKFDDASWTYTFGLGKYYKNYWFNVRTYLNAVDAGVADSYALSVRYYFGGTDDYFSARIGTGFSPDNTSNNVLFNNSARLRSNNFAIGFRTIVGSTHVIYAEASYDRIEFTTDSYDDQFSLKVGYIKRF